MEKQVQDLSRFKRLRSTLGPYFGREVMSSRIRAIRKTASSIPRGGFLEIVILSLVFVVALAVRLLPLRFGFYLSEFDPYLQWRMSEYIVKNGFLAWFSWRDTLSWYPWGLDMAHANLYGVAFSVAAVYMFLHAIGVQATVFQVTVLYPVAAGALTSIACYFLGKDLWGRGAGLLTALFMALNPSSISRTTLGFLRHEPLGILLMVLIFIFFLRANRARSFRGTIAYSIFAGVGLFYLTASWAASYYPMDLLVLYSAVLVFAGRYTRKLLFSYAATFGVFLFMTPLGVPKVGFASLTSLSYLVIPGVALLMLAREAGGQLPTWRARAYGLAFASAALAVATYALVTWGIVSLPSGKFLSVLDPFTRFDMPIVQSVSEHQPATWASFFYEYNALVFLGLFGFFFIIRRFRDTDIFLTLAALTSLYFSGSYVRLTLILAPAFSLLAAIATVEMAKPAVDILRQAVIFPKRRIPGLVRIGREFGLAILLILIIAVIPAFSKAVAAAYAPATIATSSLPSSVGTEYQDWFQALAWIHDNTPQSSVVMAWWDYGYWITALADRRTLADNGTSNTTQIAMIAQMFMRNETTAVPMMQKYNVDYVVVFVTYARTQSSSNPSFLGAGEDGKWYWMVRIANETSYGDQTILFQAKRSATTTATGGSSTTVTYYRILKNGNKIISNDTISSDQNLNDNSVLGFMMNTGVKISQATSVYFDNVFTSSNNFVLVYKVLYPKTTVITLNVDRNKVNFGESVSIKGTVTDSEGKPYATGTIALADLMTVESGQQLVAYVPMSDGKFNYDWTPSAGNHTLSAHWQGVRGETEPAASNSVQVFVQTIPVTLTISLSTYNLTLGQNVTISMRLSQKLSNGTLTAQYSLNDKTWSKLDPVEPKNGTFDLAWHPITAGTYYVEATYSGSGNYGPATSNIIMVYVKP